MKVWVGSMSVGGEVPIDLFGQRVAVPWLHSACGRCRYCVSGWETLCLAQRNTGYSVDGCYSDHVLADAAFVVPVPDGIDACEAAPLTCAGVTTYKAVKVSGARPSEVVAVFGVGGLGHLAVQYAKIAGATVVAVDVSDDKLALATSLGADVVVNAHSVAAQRRDPRPDRRRRRRDHHGRRRRTAAVRVRVATTARTARAGRTAGRQRDEAPGVRDRPRGHQRDRVDRRHSS